MSSKGNVESQKVTQINEKLNATPLEDTNILGLSQEEEWEEVEAVEGSDWIVWEEVGQTITGWIKDKERDKTFGTAIYHFLILSDNGEPETVKFFAPTDLNRKLRAIRQDEWDNTLIRITFASEQPNRYGTISKIFKVQKKKANIKNFTLKPPF